MWKWNVKNLVQGNVNIGIRSSMTKLRFSRKLALEERYAREV
jgi:hypothetical protein